MEELLKEWNLEAHLEVVFNGIDWWQ